MSEERKLVPARSILDERFRYVAAVDTDLRQRFAEVLAANERRRAIRKAEDQARAGE